MRLQYSSPSSSSTSTGGLAPCLLPGGSGLAGGGCSCCWGCCYGALLFFLWTSAAVTAASSSSSSSSSSAGGAAVSGAPGSAGASGAAASTHSPAPPLPAAVVAGGALLAAVGLPSAGVCYTSSVQELAQRSRVVVEGKVQQGAEARRRKQPEQGDASVTPGRRKAGQLDGYTETATAVSSAALATAANWIATDLATTTTIFPLHTYLVKVHQVWPVKSAGLDKDSVITVHGEFDSDCGRLKEDSRYIFFMDPTNTSSIFRASFPPLETGRTLKKDVGRVLCRGCGYRLSDTRREK